MLKIGKVYGAPIILTSNFFMYVGIYLGITLLQAGLHTALMTALAIAAIAGCVLLHEIGHLTASIRYNVRPVNITLHFFGGVASSEPGDWRKLMDRPKQSMVVWACGPLVNIVISGILLLAIFGLGKFSGIYNATMIDCLTFMLKFNLGMAIFNLLPLYPMDGGGILYSVCRLYTTKTKAVKIASMVSMIGCVLLFLAALYYHAWVLAIVMVFIFLEARGASRSPLFR